MVACYERERLETLGNGPKKGRMFVEESEPSSKPSVVSGYVHPRSLTWHLVRRLYFPFGMGKFSGVMLNFWGVVLGSLPQPKMPRLHPGLGGPRIQGVYDIVWAEDFTNQAFPISL